MSNQQGSYADFLNGIIINSLKAVRDNTINIGFSYHDEKLKLDENAGLFVSNTNKLFAAMIVEDTLRTLYSINAIDKIKNISDDTFSTIGLSVQKQYLSDAVHQLKQNAEQADNVVKKEIYQKSIDSINKYLDTINDNIRSNLLSKGIDDLDVSQTKSQDIIKKLFEQDLKVSVDDIDGKIFQNVSHVFNAGTLAFLLSNEINSENPEELLDRATYWTNWATSTILTTFPKWDVPFTDDAFKILNSIKSLSYPNLTSIAARGIITGIATDIAFKGGYWFGEEIVWGRSFKIIFDKELYEMDWFIEFSDKFYASYLGHLEGDNLNAVIAFNTMILGNFINQSGKSVVYDDTAVLFSSKEYQEMSFEKALDNYKTLYKAITGSDSADGITDAKAMIKHMQESYPIFKELRGKTMIIAQDFKSVKEYHDIALSDDKNAMAYRFALKHLLPMVILDADYSQYNQNGELNLYSKDNPNGITQEYLEARTQMLGYKLQYAKMDIDYDERSQVSGILPLPVVKGDHIYQDLDSQLKLDIDGVNPTDFGSHRYVFGGSGDDKAIGGILSDKLFGGAGNDVLNGMSGDDYLEGGIDFDTYHIQDHDTIYDSDGDGRLIFNGKNLPSVFIEQSTGLWLAKDDKDHITHSATKSGKDLIIASEDNKHTATIKNFFDVATNDQGVITALSINLATEENKEHAQKNATTFLDIDSKTSAVVYVGNPKTKLHITGSDDHRGDLYFGHGFAQKITLYANAGNDTIYGSLQGDELYGGAGNDIIFGTSPMFDSNPTNAPANDHDMIVGGQGSDLLNSGVGEDTIYADDKDSHKIVANSSEKGNWVLGGSGKDTIYGGQARDLLQGGKDNDTIYGGGGDDIILGDAHIRFDHRSKTIYGTSPSTNINYGYVGGGIHRSKKPT